MAVGLTQVLNQMNEMGIFSYAFPFMIVFAIVFGLLQKIKIFGEPKEAKGINAIIAAGIGALSLLYDRVPTFFATIFPIFGVGLAVFLVLVISLGFFYMGSEGKPADSMKWIGWLIGIGVVIWTFNEWGYIFGGGSNFGFWLQEYLPMLIVVGIIITGIVLVVGTKDSSKPGSE
jgi:hypothetical protein